MAGKVVFDTLESGAGIQVAANTLIRGAAKAWVNFDGTGTVAIRDSFNVSSITDLGVGTYNVNYITPMPNANYCGLSANARSTATVSGVTTTGASLVQRNISDAGTDYTIVFFAAFCNP